VSVLIETLTSDDASEHGIESGQSFA